jgi:hypothetical protein
VVCLHKSALGAHPFVVGSDKESKSVFAEPVESCDRGKCECPGWIGEVFLRMTEHKVLINRAPVLTLWATTVAERLGFDEDEALSLGKAVAGLNAQSKGQRLGIFKPVPQEIKKARARKRNEEYFIEICGRQVPAINTTDGVRAVIKNQPIEAEVVERYLESKFRESLGPARAAMRDLAKAFRPEQLSKNAFSLYEKFRTAIPEGVRGWGAKGNLDIDRIRSLALGM